MAIPDHSFVMLAMGLLPLAGMLWMAFGRTTVRLTRDRLKCHWGRGLLGFRRSLPVDSIEAIVLGGLSADADPRIRRSGERARSVRTKSTGCAVTGAGRWLLIAPFADRELSRQVGGLLLGKLQSWGRMVETRMGGFGDSRLTK